MTTGRFAGTTGAVPMAAAEASSYSTDGWSVSPTSVAHAARARICAPGRVAPTGVPGFTANDQDSSGHAPMSCTNFTVTKSVPAPRYSVIRSPEVNTTTYGCPSTCSRRQRKPASPGLLVVGAVGGIGISTLASSSVDRKWSVWPSLAAVRSSRSTSLVGLKSGSSGALASTGSTVRGSGVGDSGLVDPDCLQPDGSGVVAAAGVTPIGGSVAIGSVPNRPGPHGPGPHPPVRNGPGPHRPGPQPPPPPPPPPRRPPPPGARRPTR